MDSEQLVLFARQFNNVALLTYLLPLAIGLRRWRVLLPAYRPLVWFVLVPGCLLNALLAELGRHIWHNNVLILQLATVGETLCLGWTYYYAFHSERGRRVLLACVGLFLALYIAEAFFYHVATSGPPIYTHIAQSVLLVGAAVAYFEQTLRELRNIDLSEDPIFMVSVGSILYYAGTLMVFILESKLQDQPDLIWIMYIIQFILLIVFNVFLAIALWNGDQPAEYTAAPLEWPAPRE
ncbi:hypothetical protein [Hymenobacter cellulosilyticus]|uniref:Uncharacterized protein n=1 Tax=Hymenobacter cellulosilyticus TaxID=2932248 RepID=A0A8T9QBL3_9BACT|nr:hypothetical protein [Hymenobacter cellulosilyticus]UOQ74575.1 hypothetical protein MUN79_12290 [Hymenobacter cellulosilyticus]